ncbi:MAG: hypothetical protein ACYDHY_18335 [Acidiferrobacterales bacterium]
MTAMAFVYEHLGQLLIEDAPPHPRPTADSLWVRARHGSCNLCGCLSGWMRARKKDGASLCEPCYTVYHQTPMLGTNGDLGGAGVRVGALREAWAATFVIVTPERARIYLTDSAKKKVNLNRRREQVAPLVEANPALRCIEYRALSERWDDLARTSPPYVAFSPQGNGNPAALAQALAQGFPWEIHRICTWLDNSGTWCTLPATDLLVLGRLAVQMSGETQTFRDLVAEEWMSFAEGRKLGQSHSRRLRREMKIAKTSEDIGCAIDIAEERYPQIGELARRGPQHKQMLQIMLKILKERAADA